jgi:hypothetical protein
MKCNCSLLFLHLRFIFCNSHLEYFVDAGLILQRGSAALAVEATGLAVLRAVLPSTAAHISFAARGIASSSVRTAATEGEKRAQKKAAEKAERVGLD